METADHLDQVLHHLPALPASFRAALAAYLAGQGSLEHVQQKWANARQQINNFDFLLFKLWGQPGTHLNTLDRRVLDLYLATGHQSEALMALARRGPVEEAAAYLLSQGQTSEQMLQEIVALQDEAGFDYGLTYQHFSALLRFLLHRLPPTPDGFLRALNAYPFWNATAISPFGTSPRGALVHLLLALRPPVLDLAWAIAQSMEAMPLDDLGACAKALLLADPTRFTPWARRVAGPASPASNSARNTVLRALLELDGQAHLDLALAAAAEPLIDDYWHHLLQVTAFEAAYRLDPLRAQPLVEVAAHSSSHWLGPWASALLAGAPVADLAAFWWRCIAEESVPVALSAFNSLQERWYWRGLLEKQENAQKLLAHPALELREAASAWLAQYPNASM